MCHNGPNGRKISLVLVYLLMEHSQFRNVVKYKHIKYG